MVVAMSEDLGGPAGQISERGGATFVAEEGSLVRQRLWRRVWLACAVATALNGLVVGYGSVWFQLFGDSADRSDYLVSAGGYLAASAVLAVGVCGASRLAVRRGGRVAVIVVAMLLALGGLSSVQMAGSAERSSIEQSPLDGAGGVLMLPWAWVLLWSGGRALVGVARQR
jgi:hypothetical protein